MNINDTISEYFKNLDLSGLKDISTERLIEIKNSAQQYRQNIDEMLDKIPMREVFNSIVAKFCVHKELSIIIANKHILFNNSSEILAFIILAVDPNYNMAQKYLTFLEQTNSNTKAILLHKQYAKKYHAFFESKILYGELILQGKEKELTEENNLKRKRTITG